MNGSRSFMSVSVLRWNEVRIIIMLNSIKTSGVCLRKIGVIGPGRTLAKMHSRV